MADRDELLERLNDVHEFPCDYLFKVIGENSDAFVARVTQAAINVVGASARARITTRESSGGKHLAVSMTVQLQDAESVLEVYSLLSGLEGVRFIL